MVEETEKIENEKEVDKLNKKISQFKLNLKELNNKYTKLKIENLMLHNQFHNANNRVVLNQNNPSSFIGFQRNEKLNNFTCSKIEFETNQNEPHSNDININFLLQKENNELLIKKKLNKTNNIKDLLQSTRLCSLLNSLGGLENFVDLISLIIK